MRARDRSDLDNAINGLDTRLKYVTKLAENHQSFLGSISKMLSIVIESLNMQMEAENADQLDRQMMSLYGLQKEKPSAMDMFGRDTQLFQDQNHQMFV